MEAAIVGHVRISDTLLIPNISYQLSLGNRLGNSGMLCITKPVGNLSFAVSTKQLGIIEITENLEFVGTPDDGGQPIITWRVSKDIDDWVSGAHLTHIEGALVTSVDAVDPTLALSCAGEQRVVEAALNTIGTDNTLTVNTSVGDIKASNFAIAAPGVSCAEVVSPLNFQVNIHVSSWKQTLCHDRYETVGSTVKLTANLVNLQTLGALTGESYRWTLPPGVQLVGAVDGVDGHSVTVQLLNPGDFIVYVKVAVTTDTQSGQQTGSVLLPTLIPNDAALLFFGCQLRQYAQQLEVLSRAVVGVGPGVTLGDGSRLVDPLYDPPPDERDLGLARRLVEFKFAQVQRAREEAVHALGQLIHSVQGAVEDRLSLLKRG